MSLDRKLQTHERYAHRALVCIRQWLETDDEGLLAMARGRHVWGHYRHGDTLFYEYSPEQLLSEAAEEIADCINYWARRLELLDES